MAVYGNLASMPVSELLQWLGGNGKTGLLRVEQDGMATRLFFERGRVVACISDDPRHLLGQFLLFRGAITQADLREAMAAQDSTGRSLPDILVERGAIPSVRLETEVVAKAQETVLALFECSEATFWYREAIKAEEKAVRVDLDVQGLLLEGMKRLDELAELKKVFPHPDVIPRRGEELVSPGVFDDGASRTIYEAVNGKRSLAEIQLLVHGTEFQVYRQLHRLQERGLIQVDVQEHRPEDATAELVPFESGLSLADGETTVEAPPRTEPQPEAQEEEALDLDFDLGGLPLEVPLREEPSETEAQTLEEVVLEAEPVEPPPLENLLIDDELPEEEVLETPALEALGAEPPRVEAPVLEMEPPESAGLPALDEIDLGVEIEDAASDAADRAAVPAADLPEPDFEEVHAAVESHLQIAREQLSRSEPEAALDQLQQASRVGPGHPSIGAMRAQSEAAMLQRYLREGLRPERRPVVVATREQLEAAETSPAQDYLLGLADGTWDIHSVLSVSPLRPLEVMKALNGLLMRGLIELREPISASGARVGGKGTARSAF